MDIVSHGLWGALAAKLINGRLRAQRAGARKLDPLLAGFWGFAPDIVAFMPITMLFIGGLMAGSIDAHDIPRPREQSGAELQNSAGIYALTHQIYQVTHSAVIFMAAFVAVYLVRRHLLKRKNAAPVYEMCAWLLHILIDLPTHSHEFYPTPILWPISEWQYDGTPWSTPWIIIPNYILLIVGFIYVRRRRRRTELISGSEPSLAAVPIERE